MVMVVGGLTPTTSGELVYHVLPPVYNAGRPPPTPVSHPRLPTTTTTTRPPPSTIKLTHQPPPHFVPKLPPSLPPAQEQPPPPKSPPFTPIFHNPKPSVPSLPVTPHVSFNPSTQNPPTLHPPPPSFPSTPTVIQGISFSQPISRPITTKASPHSSQATTKPIQIQPISSLLNPKPSSPHKRRKPKPTHKKPIPKDTSRGNDQPTNIEIAEANINEVKDWSLRV